PRVARFALIRPWLATDAELERELVVLPGAIFVLDLRADEPSDHVGVRARGRAVRRRTRVPHDVPRELRGVRVESAALDGSGREGQSDRHGREARGFGRRCLPPRATRGYRPSGPLSESALPDATKPPRSTASLGARSPEALITETLLRSPSLIN